MKMNHILTTTLIFLLFNVNSTLAASPEKSSNDPATAADIVAAIDRLNQRLTNLKLAEIETQNDKDAQSIHHSQEKKLNKSQIQEITNRKMETNTQQQITHWLSDLPNQLGLIPNKNKNKLDPTTALTTDITASDTLNVPSSSFFSVFSNPPDMKKEDNVFNFDSLFSPIVYTAEQQQVIEKYKQFLIPHYESPSDGINLNTLKNIINQNPNKAADYLRRLQESTDYKKYQLAIRSKIAVDSVLLSNLNALIADARARGETIVMTNGCFDLLHLGHLEYLAAAKALGDRLIVAVNDDASVSRLKGPSRPLNTVSARTALLAALEVVDWVIPFSEDTPLSLISKVLPDVLVKGDDYKEEDIVGRDIVLQHGGQVRTIPLTPEYSTSRMIEKMREIVT